ncbi:nucleic acid-binding, OB-fold-like protein [Actinidia rufa]|uniref:Nucleic acid-binding, OB-fold-like protein n=1 Tax=Actinidia rufa TaxID=165716 RepID=A0A7J0G552_9ERIC|nr:nucleic acid-binding, OB-fold-like protein [Actinidia rufa]
MVTLLSVGTGGIQNNRRPLDNEELREYANRCAVQWHRVSIYPERVGEIAMKHAVPGYPGKVDCYAHLFSKTTAAWKSVFTNAQFDTALVIIHVKS